MVNRAVPLTRVLAAGVLCGLLVFTAAACAPEPEPVATDPAPAPVPEPEPQPEPEPEPEPTFDMSQHALDDPDSIWVVVNKHRPLDPIDYVPADLVQPNWDANVWGHPLREEAARAAEALLDAAAEAGHPLQIDSGYRAYDLQYELYWNLANASGQDVADLDTARPGYSEHQTGLTMDVGDGVCSLDVCFADQPGGQWVAEHGAEYGFIVRYPFDKQEITGYVPEPWHLRYVGVELALEMRAQGVDTLEEFFGLDAAPGYLE